MRDAGKMSAVLEDHSPIQITTAGMYAGQAFGVVGRIQLRYDDGFWNEWYILFDDGRAGWLSDASGQYAVTLDDGIAENAQPFGRLVPGGRYRHDGQTYSLADLRTARCTGGEGELPFVVGPGWEARVADYRQAHRFLTLDYSDSPKPRRYMGKAVGLEDLKCQLLRAPEQIRRSAGHLRGEASTLACPACGASIHWRPAVAAHLHCPACGTVSEATTSTLEVMDASRREALADTSLALGDQARFDGQDWMLIGLLRQRETDSDETWTEYLLYSLSGRFLWLVESSLGWDKVQVLDTWPEAVSASAVTLDGVAFTRLQAYGAEVVYAAGAFNWRVRVGDRVSLTDYRRVGRGILCCERSRAEITWSMAQRVPASQVDGWFAKGGALAAHATQELKVPAEVAAPEVLRPLAWIFSGVLLLINVPLSFMGGVSSWIITLLALAVLWLPLHTDWFEPRE